MWQHLQGDKSDFYDVTQKWPAVFGWELAHRPDDKSATYNYITYDATIAQAKQAYNKGAINTFATHPFRIDRQTNCYDTAYGYIAKIIPGGDLHEAYKNYLDVWANALKSLIDENNQPIPFIFRPYHEMDGNWFWWGTASCSDDEYKQLFRFTVFYLRNAGLKNMLVCYAPAIFTNQNSYLNRYPGDDVVDILGMDHYYKSCNTNSNNGDPNWNNYTNKVNIIQQIAVHKNKIAAISETGQQNLTSNNYFTQLHEAIPSNGTLAYMMFWANYTLQVDGGGGNGYYIPYQNSNATIRQDFVNFLNISRFKSAGTYPNLY